MRNHVVLLTDQSEKTGGMEVGLLELISHIDRERFRLTVSGPPGPLLEEAKEIVETVSCSIVPFDTRPACRALFRLVRDGRRLGRELAALLSDRPADLLHTVSFGAHLLGAVAVRALNCPVLWDVEDFYSHPFERFLFANLARGGRTSAIFLGPETEARFPGRSLVHRRTVQGGVDIARFSPGGDREGVRREWGIPAEAEVVGFLGQLIPRKRVKELIEGASAARRGREGIHLLLAGETSPHFAQYGDDLRLLARQCGDWIHFTGRRNDPERVLNAVDLLVFPSREEPFGRVVLEALAAGVPLVALRSSGAAASLPESSYAAAGDDSAGALGEVIASVLADGERRRRMSRTGRNLVEQFFSAAARARQVEAFYDEIIQA